MVEAGAWWTVPAAPAVLLGFAVLAVVGDAALDARSAGRPLTLDTVVRPLLAVSRALSAQPRRLPAPDRLLWRAGVITVPTAAVLSTLVIPFGDRVVADLSVGVVWFNAMEALTWAGLWLAGWGPNAAFSLIGGYRFLAQGLAYELPLMFALISAATGARSLRVTDIAGAQHGLWYAVWMPFAFVVYLAGVLAFSFLGPFAYPAGRDVAGGVLGETCGVDRLLLQAGRWLWLAAGAAMAVPLFLGGGAGPGLPSWAWSLAKTLLVLGLLVWAPRRMPAIRADRYVELAWVLLLPPAVLQVLVPALVDLNL
ncbi:MULTISPECIES: NADH-quinone oxidoreductase subunit H [unclassified Streptomyces]|uniref:NADH-quinone oxidoreductase subunit H n=1 Tax=unclassified Streptomyces TaxID=2593676 RepID=UPI001F03CA33|nr:MULTISPECIES: NADH-quinone oxidoreductase subunit H [unclassified Streptomyces]MCH0562419.1 NADH-quinone oxidoreductase subunit H [Streptomyces sp. MUM 2J]MCH0570395.1 NADH-quinone oxidoreductase subunit H [Streptomyces sp. MUM 136J]